MEQLKSPSRGVKGVLEGMAGDESDTGDLVAVAVSQ
jgi:hypothetical protein